MGFGGKGVVLFCGSGLAEVGGAVVVSGLGCLFILTSSSSSAALGHSL